MVEIIHKQCEIIESSERPYTTPDRVYCDEVSTGNLKSMIMTTKDYVFVVGVRNPDLWLTQNISEFIREVQRAGCPALDRTIERVIRMCKQMLRQNGVVFDDAGMRMSAEHRTAYAELMRAGE